MNAKSPIEVVLLFIEKIDKQNIEALVDIMSDDHKFVDVLGEWRIHADNEPVHRIMTKKNR